MKQTVRYIIILAIIVATVILTRIFIVGSYLITSNNIGDTLKSGDYVLVNKLKYFTEIKRNDLLLYQSPLRIDAANPPMFVGRCIGIPGDKIQMGIDGFRVNGHLLPNAPQMHPVFRIQKHVKQSLLNTMEVLHIPLRDIQEDSLSLTLRLSLKEKELLVNHLSHVVKIEMTDNKQLEYNFVIPSKGELININEIELMVCKEAIINELGDMAFLRDGKLYNNGVKLESYIFQNDYYWILSENETDGIDSRYLGLIPADHITGIIWYCWYSPDASRRFKIIR